MNDIVNIVIANLIMVGAFLVPLLLMRVADVVLGVAIAKKNKIKWSWHKFLWGAFYSVCFIVGTALFVTSVSLIVPLINSYGIVSDESVIAALNSISTVAVCVVVASVTIVSYGKDCFEKIRVLVGKPNK